MRQRSHGTEIVLLAGLALWYCLCAGCSGRGPPSTQPLFVFCTASAGDVIEQLAEDFERETGIRVHVSTAASSTLARQIEQGAPADLFISAHPEWCAYLEGIGRLRNERLRRFARNALVIVAATDGPSTLPELPSRVAIADPAYVPLGRYTRQALESLGRWESWQSRFLPALDARAAVEYVRRGEAPIGIIYRTDALAFPELIVLESIEARHHDPIELLLAPLEGCDPRTEALCEFCTGPAARDLLRARGFVVDEERE